MDEEIKPNKSRGKGVSKSGPPVLIYCTEIYWTECGEKKTSAFSPRKSQPSVPFPFLPTARVSVAAALPCARALSSPGPSSTASSLR